MEPKNRQIEEHTDATGRRRRTVLRTVTVHEEKLLEPILKRLDKSLELVGCANVLCHLEHWVEHESEAWSVMIRSRHLPTLRSHLAHRELNQEELIALSSDPQKARQELRFYHNQIRLPDKTVVQLALDVCTALEHATNAGLQKCEVTPDTIYLSAGGKWLLGDIHMAAGESTGTAGLASVLHQLLGGTESDAEPPFGGTELCMLVKQARQKEMELPELRKRLEYLAGYRQPESKPEPVQKPVQPKPQPAPAQKPAQPKPQPAPAQKPVQPKPQPAPAQKPVQPKPQPTPAQKPNPQPTLRDTILKKVHLSAMISAGDGFTAAVRRNGTVCSTRIFSGLAGWTGIKAVAVGGSHMLGLRQDGRVNAAGSSFHGQCDVGKWSNIIQVTAGACHSAGLKSDGTVVVAGWINDNFQNASQWWRNIAAISSGNQHLVGLRSDGTVVAAGNMMQNRCSVGSWRNIVAVSAGAVHTVGLRSDGTVVATGANLHGQCNVGEWTDIIAIDAGADHTVGLRADGTVLATGNFNFGACAVGGMRDIIAISAGWSTTVGLKSDGTLVAIGKNDYGQCDVSHWNGLN